MAKEWRRPSAQKRGAGNAQVPIDTAFAERRYAADRAGQSTPEEAFDRQWALTLLDLTVQRLQAEFAAAGKANDFDALKGSLTAAYGAIDYSSVARQLKTSEGAARVAVHRLRKRFRELYREEISHTLSADADLEVELRYLAQVLARA
jgi:RNA polymerase sigma-70 factor (ECF subfamily)